MTKQKKLVLTIIERSHGHLSAEEIFFRAREEMPNIALGTVYRNLNALTEEGIVIHMESLTACTEESRNPKVLL